jgi:hypothetical protein
MQNQKFKVTKKSFQNYFFRLFKNFFSKINISKVTDSEQKTEKVLAKLNKIFSNMTLLEEKFSIETPRLMVVHKKSNVSSFSFDMEIENNSFKMVGSFNLINDKNLLNNIKQLTLKVNYSCFVSI